MARDQRSSHPRLGLAGFGRIAERVYVPILAELGISPVAIIDPSIERQRVAATLVPEVAVYRALEDARGLGLDGVIIATPNHAHAVLSVQALEFGAGVLCEKPLATSSAEATRMHDAALRFDRPLVAAYPNSHRPEIVALAQLCAAGRFGRIESIRLAWLRCAGVPGGWFAKRALSGGGALMDLGSHLLHVGAMLHEPSPVRRISCALRAATPGAPKSATWYAPASSDDGAMDVEVAAEGFIEFVSGVTLHVDVAWTCATPQDRTQIRVRGTGGEASVNTLFGLSPYGDRPQFPLTFWEMETGERQGLVRGAHDLLQPYRAQITAFLAALGHGHQPDAHLRSALETSKLVEELYRNGRSH